MKIEISHRSGNKIHAEKVALSKLQPNDWLRFERNTIIIDLPETSHREEMWKSPYKMGQALARLLAWSDEPELSCSDFDTPLSAEDIQSLNKVRAFVTDPDVWARHGCRWWQSPKNLYLTTVSENKASKLLEIADKTCYKEDKWPISKALVRFIPMMDWSEAKKSAGLTADERLILSRVIAHLKA